MRRLLAALALVLAVTACGAEPDGHTSDVSGWKDIGDVCDCNGVKMINVNGVTCIVASRTSSKAGLAIDCDWDNAPGRPTPAVTP